MLAGVIARMRSMWRGIRRRPDVEAEMGEEFRLHLELRAADLVREGLAPADAARKARLEFGAADYYKDQAREARGLRRVDAIKFSWLDFKLGYRMLVRYPGLTLVGGFAMAFATWAGAGTFEFVRQVVNPALPLPEGDRVVALRNSDASSALLGRTLVSTDEVPGAPNVVVIGYETWQRRFAGDPNVVGRSVQLNGVATERQVRYADAN